MDYSNISCDFDAAELFGRSRQVEAMTVHVGLSKSDFGKDHILAAVHGSQISPNSQTNLQKSETYCRTAVQAQCTLTALNLLLRDDSHDLPRVAGTHGSSRDSIHRWLTNRMV